MKRRQFITLLGGAAAWPLVAHGQPAMPVIGFLVGGTPSSHGHLVAAFTKRLHELGWIEGRTVTIEIRWAEGRTERFAAIAAELGLRKIDVIVAPGLGVPAAKQAARPSLSSLWGLPIRSPPAWSRRWRGRTAT